MAQTVLLIDYDPRSVARIRDLLSRHGLRVLLATDGQAGLEEFHRSLPDLVLVQDLLPKKHGFEVCNEIKHADDGKTRPVVILGAGSGRKARVQTDCDAYIGKPFEEAELLEMVGKLLPGALDAAAGPEPSPDRPAAGPERRPPVTVEFTEADLDERLDEVLASLAV